ncbi:MAG TPA: M23 family metallopeptidase [Steroidobacteraceae bacterium]|nr:M23 family metallopeptidase [Steroidobacteraceae bacterium]
MALVIVSAGPLTDSRLHTVGMRRLAAAAAVVTLLAMSLCFTMGYLIARGGDDAAIAAAGGPVALDLNQPEGRALIERIGTLAGRLSRLESEATALGRRLGDPGPASAAGTPAGQVPAAPEIVAAESVERAKNPPSGGPLVPLADVAAPAPAATAARYDYGTGLARLETVLSRLEIELAELDAATAERQLANMAYPYRLPVLGQEFDISSAFGVRRDPFTGRLARHTGLDIPAPRGTPILASGGGRVRSAGYHGAYGYTVIIDHGDGLSTLYGHASKLFVRKGDVVMPKQRIAAVGSSGRSTGPHLHFEVIRNGARVEPKQFLAQVLPASVQP